MAHARSAHAIRPRLLDMTIRAILAGMAVSAPALHADEDKTRTLEQVTVIAQQDSNKAGSTKVISTDELNKRGESPTMGNLLRYEPLISAPAKASGSSGTIYDGAGNNGYNIRGVEANRVALDVDGIGLPEAAVMPDSSTTSRFSAGRDYIDPEMFREIRIESGATTAGRGPQGLGGGVAFVTKSPDDYVSKEKPRHVDIKTGYNSVNESYVNAITGALQQGDTQLLLSYAHRNGEETQNKGRIRPNGDDWKSDAILAKLQQQLSSLHRVGLVLDYFKREGDRTLDTRNPNITPGSYPDGASQAATAERTRISLEHRFTPGNDWIFDRLDSRVYLQDTSMQDVTVAPRFISSGQTYHRRMNSDFTNNSLGLTLDASKISGNHALSYGINADQTKVARPWSDTRTCLTVGGACPAVGTVTNPQRTRMADSTIFKASGYVRDDISLGDSKHKITLTPGLRIDHQGFRPDKGRYALSIGGGTGAAAAELKESSDLSVLPSLGLAVELKPGFSAYGQLSLGARVPGAQEKTGNFDNASTGYAILGNPNLKKETSTAFEVGMKGAPTNGVTLHTALFQTQYKNFIEYAALSRAEALAVGLTDVTFGPTTIPATLYRPVNVGDANIWGAELSTRAELGTWLTSVDGSYVALAIGSSRGKAKNTRTGASSEVASVAPARGSLTLGYDALSKRFGVAVTTTHSKSKEASEDVTAASPSAAFTRRFDVKSYTVHDLSAYWNINKKLSTSAGIYNIGDKKYWDYASVRSLAAPTTTATTNDIERQTMPGRSFAVSLNLKF